MLVQADCREALINGNRFFSLTLCIFFINMIESVDQKLIEWAGTLLGGTEISLGAPTQEDADVVGIYLMDILPSSPARGTRRAPLQVMLRYLVTTGAQNPLNAHKMLGRLLFAAMEHPEYEVELAPVSARVWAAFGIMPRPSFMICLPLRFERPDLTKHKVSAPIEIRRSPLSSMHGVVVGPENIPLGNAHVELPACNLVTCTDSNGRFAFDVVPALPPVKQLHIRARGQEMVRSIEQTDINQGELRIHFDL